MGRGSRIKMGKATMRFMGFIALTSLVIAMIVTAACSSKPLSLDDVPAYPGAVVHTAEQGGIGATLDKNMQTDAAVRKAVGVGGSTQQKGFRLPNNATWDDVKRFYDDKMKAQGWASGGGGKAGDMVSGVMDAVNQNNPMSQTAIWAKGKQNLTIIMVTNPINKTDKDLLISLSTR